MITHALIESDGTDHGTQVFLVDEDGQKIEITQVVRSVQWTAEADALPTVHLTINASDLKVVAQEVKAAVLYLEKEGAEQEQKKQMR